MIKKLKPYIISIAIALGVGGLSAFLTRNSFDLYSDIVKPPLAPPSILFPIVWSVLYVLMGISAAMIYQRIKEQPMEVQNALAVYAMSLVVNFSWSLIFFNLRAFLIAFLWLIFLLILVVRTIICYKKISPPAAYLQIPYAVWVAFAGYLSCAIWILN